MDWSNGRTAWSVTCRLEIRQQGDGLGHATLQGDSSIKRLAGILTDTDEGFVVLDYQKNAVDKYFIYLFVMVAWSATLPQSSLGLMSRSLCE